MRIRPILLLFIAGLSLALTACNSSGLDSIAISPAYQSITVGQSAAFLVTGTFGNANKPTTGDVTSQANWTSSAPSIVTFTSPGVATASAAGSYTITASIPGFNGIKTATATLYVTAAASGATTGQVSAVSSGTALIKGTAQNADGALTNSPAVPLSCPYVAPTYDSNGNVTDDSQCNTQTILTVYNTNLKTTGWRVTAPSATGTANVIDCGPGAASTSVCAASYPVNTSVILTAWPETGVAFGGWSWNCTPVDVTGNVISSSGITAAGPNYCKVFLGATNSNTGAPASIVSVGANFNNSN